ncbi:MAG: exosortase F system-associated protein [Flavobacteriaceae bacterium]|nr:exosortase F system-associated protein [Flavobacteriaceae bacterium]
MSRFQRIILIIVFVGILALIRGLAGAVFYDPLLIFFKYDYLNSTLPDTDFLKLIIHIFFRYSLNSSVSLAIIYLVFVKRDIVLFSIWIFIIGFVVFAIPYYFIITNYNKENYLLLFYVRRFLIQPILLLFLLPAFYYQKLTEN